MALEHGAQPSARSRTAILRTQRCCGQRDAFKVRVVFEGRTPPALFPNGGRTSCGKERGFVPRLRPWHVALGMPSHPPCAGCLPFRSACCLLSHPLQQHTAAWVPSAAHKLSVPRPQHGERSAKAGAPPGPAASSSCSVGWDRQGSGRQSRTGAMCYGSVHPSMQSFISHAF